ncbi:MAG: VWA-like domain-containing protein [Paludibacteraceae bacterium]|nr:VWA-like domain-containing protein [Paludibacteraceae bacterium]MCK9616113.1 VWA-like domain-containing protein [Candidatus Omnitrophota bacterium]
MAEKEIIKASISLLKEKPLYAHIFQRMEKVYVGKGHKINKMAVGLNESGNRIVFYVNEYYINGLIKEGKEDVVSKSVEHEILHIIFKHVFVDITGYDNEKINIAMDISCNQYIHNHPTNWYDIQCYGFPSERTWKWYYDHLPKSKDDKGKEKTEHSLWENKKTDDLSISEEILRTIVKDAIKESESGGGYGNIGFEVISELKGFFKKPINKNKWKFLLRNFVANSTETDIETTKNRVSKRYGTRPGLINRSRLNLACTIDISSSICDDQILRFIKEIDCVYKNGADITIIEADTEVRNHYSYKGKFSGKIHGRGGTNFNPAIRFVEDNRFDAHIYFTDFVAGKVVEKFRTPILWVLTQKIDSKRFPCEKGRIIILEKLDV